MFPDFSGLVYMAVLGLIMLFGAIIPGAAAGLLMLIWHAFTNEWLITAGIIGAVIGLIPGGAILFSMFWYGIKGWIEDKKRENG